MNWCHSLSSVISELLILDPLGDYNFIIRKRKFHFKKCVNSPEGKTKIWHSLTYKKRWTNL